MTKAELIKELDAIRSKIESLEDDEPEIKVGDLVYCWDDNFRVRVGVYDGYDDEKISCCHRVNCGWWDHIKLYDKAWLPKTKHDGSDKAPVDGPVWVWFGNGSNSGFFDSEPIIWKGVTHYCSLKGAV